MHARTTQNEMFSWLGSCESKDILRVPPFYKGYTLKKCSFSSTSILTSSCGINDEEKSRRNHGERRIHKGSLEQILHIESSGCPFGAALDSLMQAHIKSLVSCNSTLNACLNAFLIHFELTSGPHCGDLCRQEAVPFVANPDEICSIRANIYHPKVDESISQTPPFWSLFLGSGILFGSNSSTLDLSWTSLCPLVGALLGNCLVWSHSGGKEDSL